MNNNHRGLPSSHPAISRWSSQTRDASGGSQVNSCHFCQNERELPHLRCHQHAGCADRRLLEVRDRLLSAGTHAQITRGKYCSTLSLRLVPDFYHLDKYCSRPQCIPAASSASSLLPNIVCSLTSRAPSPLLQPAKCRTYDRADRKLFEVRPIAFPPLS